MHSTYDNTQNSESKKQPLRMKCEMTKVTIRQPFAKNILKYQDDIVKNYLLKLTFNIFKEQNWPFKLPG